MLQPKWIFEDAISIPLKATTNIREVSITTLPKFAFEQSTHFSSFLLEKGIRDTCLGHSYLGEKQTQTQQNKTKSCLIKIRTNTNTNKIQIRNGRTRTRKPYSSRLEDTSWGHVARASWTNFLLSSKMNKSLLRELDQEKTLTRFPPPPLLFRPLKPIIALLSLIIIKSDASGPQGQDKQDSLQLEQFEPIKKLNQIKTQQNKTRLR